MTWNVVVHPLSSTVIGLEQTQPAIAGEYGVDFKGFTARFDLAVETPSLTGLWFSTLELDDPTARLGEVIGADLAQRCMAIVATMDSPSALPSDADYDSSSPGGSSPFVDEYGEDLQVPLIDSEEELREEAGRARPALLRRYPLDDDDQLPGWIFDLDLGDVPDDPFAVPTGGEGRVEQHLWWRGLADSGLRALGRPVSSIVRDGETVRVEHDTSGVEPSMGLLVRLVDQRGRPDVIARTALADRAAEFTGVGQDWTVRAEVVDHPLRPVLDRRAFTADMARQAGVMAVAVDFAEGDPDLARRWWGRAAVLYQKAGPGWGQAAAETGQRSN